MAKGNKIIIASSSVAPVYFCDFNLKKITFHYIFITTGNYPTNSGNEKNERFVDLQLDEMWSFVKNKRKEQWIWIALDKKNKGNCWIIYWRAL